jgi:hypothetical protein
VRHPFIAAAVAVVMTLSAPARADVVKLAANAPDRYVVVKGDTLWDISGKFLKDPWRWPQIWNLNRAEIKNPHWIYPGDTVVLDRSGATPRLRLIKGDKNGMTNVKLSPGVRATELGSDAIQTIPMQAILPFLSQPRVVPVGALDRAPFILGSNEDRVVLGAGDDAFATGGPDGVTRWNILRPGKTLKDPETGEVLGTEVVYLGDARTTLPGAPQKIRITRSVQEIAAKDKLVEADTSTTFEYVPHAPEATVRGRIISAYGGISDSGRYQTVVINRGTRDGLEPGNVLAIYREGHAVELSRDEKDKLAWVADKQGIPEGAAWLYDDVRCLKQNQSISYNGGDDVKSAFRHTCLDQGSEDAVKLPDSRSGLLMVYRVFDRVSYALIMQSKRPVYLLDVVKNP